MGGARRPHRTVTVGTRLSLDGVDGIRWGVRRRRVPSLVLCLLALGCGDDAAPPDGGRADAGAVDGGPPDGDDAGPAGVDGGPPEGDDAGPEGDAGPAPGDAGAARSIPDPGGEMDRWAPTGMINIPDGHGTPETAWQVGTVTEDPWYIGGRLDDVTGDAFWVLRTGPGVTSLAIPLRGLGVAEIEHLHLHDGEGLVFGAEVAPDRYEVGTDGGRMAIDATWTVLPDHVYVVEVHGSMGTFF